MSDTTPLRFGIIGTGMIAKYHATAIRAVAGAELVAICRSQGGDTAAASAAFGVPCEESVEALLARDDIDAVCICTPSGMHAAQTIAAAQAGKHVMVEKPMALTLADADAMIDACAQAGVTLAIALQRRTDPHFIAVHRAISEGKLGKLTLGSVSIPYTRPQSYYDSAEWRGTWALDGGGALMNQGIHLLDLLIWFLGDIAAVEASAATLGHTIEVEDCIAASLRFANGALGTVNATTAAGPGYPHRVEVYGTEAGIQIEGEHITRAKGDSIVPILSSIISDEVQDAGAGAAPTGISADGHIRLITDFIAAVAEGRAPVVPGAEGRRSLAAVLAIYQAAGVGPGAS